MSKEYLEAYFKIDNTICLNSQNIKFGIDEDDHIDCQNIDEVVNCLETIKEALERLESIDNAEPSEALECSLKLYKMVESAGNGKGFSLNKAWEYHNTIKEALLKAKEPKQYLKWEDLEFGVPESLPPTIKVKMGDTQYCLCLRISFSDVKSVVLRDNNLKPILHLFEKEKQIFNDLHLERVEE